MPPSHNLVCNTNLQQSSDLVTSHNVCAIVMVSLLLGVAERPNPREIAARADEATTAFLQLHPLHNDAPAI